MAKEKSLREQYQEKIHRNKNALVIEILVTCFIAVLVCVNSMFALREHAKQYIDDAQREYDNLMTSYVRQFDAVYLQIEEQLKENPSLEEMDTWLKSKDTIWKKSLGGSDIYDGVGIAYKDGYARSWSYGDYSEYDPSSREWYRVAKNANGKTAIMPPYVTYLDAQQENKDSYLVMSIVKKYDETTYVNYDINLSEIQHVLQNREQPYIDEQLFMIDDEGYILSSNNKNLFSYNINEPGAVLSESFCNAIKYSQSKVENIRFVMIEHTLHLIYSNQTDKGYYISMLIPFSEVARHDFLSIFLVLLCLIGVEILLYWRNYRNLLEFHSRDERLTSVVHAIFISRIYVNLEDMTHYGEQDTARFVEGNSYEELYRYFMENVVEPEDCGLFSEYFSPEALLTFGDQRYQLQAKKIHMLWPQTDGTKRPCTMEISRLASIINGKSTVGILTRDVSEDAAILKDALKQAESASKAKGFFLSNMSHEIRTPLNAIIGYLSIAKDSDITVEKMKHCVDNSEVAARHLLHIINDVLDMSSIESGKLKIAHEAFDLKKTIGEITTIYYQNTKQKGLQYETSIDGLTEEWVVGDSLRLNQILMNLLSNAVKFTPEKGSVGLLIQQVNEDENRVYLKFIVSDTGIGMSKEYMTHMFQPFEQETALTARKYGGSGLGLSITNNLVSMMGGTIKVESEQNKGTTFEVTLHFEKTKEHKRPLQVPVEYSHVHVLVVDDRQEDGTYVKTMLKGCGVKADAVTSGVDALKRLRGRMGSEYAYDLCILDWNMPKMNGMEVATRIRQEFGPELPVIIATAYDTSSLMEEAKEAGVNQVIAKPLFQSTLMDSLVTTFGSYQPEKTAAKTEVLDMSGVRVLLAEDNEMNMEIAVTILEKAGIQVDSAVNGEEALQTFLKAKEGTYDMILMDVQMPVMDGYEATENIRKSSHPEAKSIPVIAMTANAFAEDVTEALSHGMNAHIAKPINYDKLFELVDKYAKKLHG